MGFLGPICTQILDLFLYDLGLALKGSESRSALSPKVIREYPWHMALSVKMKTKILL